MVFCLSADSSGCQGCDFVNNLFECSRCPFVCSEEDVFRCHLNTTHKSNFLPCIHCRTIYNTSNNLLRHLRIYHSSVKVYQCGSEQCSFKTASEKKFLSHLDLCTAGRPIKCYHCKSIFLSTRSLVLHMQKNVKVSFCAQYQTNSVISAFHRIESQPLLVSQIPSLIKGSPYVINQTKKSDKNSLSLKASPKKPLYTNRNLDQTKKSRKNASTYRTFCTYGPSHGMSVPNASSSNGSPSELDQTKISNNGVPSLQAVCPTEPTRKILVPIASSSNWSPCHLDQTKTPSKGVSSVQAVCTTESGQKKLVPIVPPSDWSPICLKPTKTYGKQVLSAATSVTNQSPPTSSKRLPYILPKPDTPKFVVLTDSANIASPSFVQAVLQANNTLKDNSNKLHVFDPQPAKDALKDSSSKLNVFDSQPVLPVSHGTKNCTSAANGISLLVEPFTRKPTSLTTASLIQSKNAKNVIGPVSTSVVTASTTVPLSVKQMSVRSHSADIPRKHNLDSFLFGNTDSTKNVLTKSTFPIDRAYGTPEPSSHMCLESSVPAYIRAVSTVSQWPVGTYDNSACGSTYPVLQSGSSNETGYVHMSEHLGTHFVPTATQHSITTNPVVSSNTNHCYLENKPSFSSADTSPFCASLVSSLLPLSISCHELERDIKCNPNAKLNLPCEPGSKSTEGTLNCSLDRSEVPLLKDVSIINKTSSNSDQYCKETLSSCVPGLRSCKIMTSVENSCNTAIAAPIVEAPVTFCKGSESCSLKSDVPYYTDNVVTESNSEPSAKSVAFDCGKGMDLFHLNQVIFDRKKYANKKSSDSICKSAASFGFSEKSCEGFENYEACHAAAMKSSSSCEQKGTCFSTITSSCSYQDKVAFTPVVKQEPVDNDFILPGTCISDACQSEIPVRSALNQKPIVESSVIQCEGNSFKSDMLYYTDNMVTESSSEQSAESDAFDQANCKDSFHINQKPFDSKSQVNVKSRSFINSGISEKSHDRFDDYERYHVAAMRSPILHERKDVARFSPMPATDTYQDIVSLSPIVKQESVSPRTSVSYSPCTLVNNNIIFSETCVAHTCQDEIPLALALNPKPISSAIKIGLNITPLSSSSSPTFLCEDTTSLPDTFAPDIYENVNPFERQNTLQAIVSERCSVSPKGKLVSSSHRMESDQMSSFPSPPSALVMHIKTEPNSEYELQNESPTLGETLVVPLNDTVNSEVELDVNNFQITSSHQNKCVTSTTWMYSNSTNVESGFASQPFISDFRNKGDEVRNELSCEDTTSLPDTFAPDIYENVNPFKNQNTLPVVVSEKCSVSPKGKLVSSSRRTESDQMSSFPSPQSALVMHIKTEPNSEYELQNESPTLGETLVVPLNDTVNSEVELDVNNFQITSSHRNQCVTSTTWIYSNSTNVEPGFAPQPFTSNFHNKGDSTAATHNLNNRHFPFDFTLASSVLSRAGTVPVNSLCNTTVTSCTDEPCNSLNISSDTSVIPHNTDLTYLTSSRISGASLSTQISPCDFTFTTLATKPIVCSSTDLFRNQSLCTSKTNCHNKESVTEPLLLTPVTSESSISSRIFDTVINSDSMETFPGVEPINPTFSPLVGVPSNGGSLQHKELNSKISPNSDVTEETCFAHQYDGLPNSTSANDAYKGESGIREINLTPKDDVLNSQKVSLMQSNLCSPVTVLHQSVSNKLPSSVSEDHSTNHVGSFGHRVADTSNIIPRESLTISALLSSVENTANCTNDDVMLDSATEGYNSIPRTDVSSTSDDDRHPFLNSTSLTVRQILEKFRWKRKKEANSLSRSTLKSVDQAYKGTKHSERRQFPKCETGIPSLSTKAVSQDKNIFKPLVSSLAIPPLFDTHKQVVACGSQALGKRKFAKMINASVRTQPPKVQKVLENVTYVKVNNFSQHGKSENCIMSELSPSNVKEHCVNRSTADKPKAVQLMSEVLCNLSFEDILSGIDIFLVAKELLSYDGTAVETDDTGTDILQTLKQKKSTAALKTLLHPLLLINFFKCMEKHCIYTSNSCRDFNNHLKKHAPVFECAYCLSTFLAPVNLMCHLMQQHKRCLFQCSLCFYRAYSETHVRIHLKRSHLHDGGCCFLCPSVDSFPVPAFNEHCMLHQSSVAQPCRCCFSDCQFVSIALLDIVHHILYHHLGRSPYVCRECKQECSHVWDWLVHCRAHGIHLLHCIYCAYGAESRSEILNHMSLRHASDSLVVFVRSSRCVMIHLEHILRVEGNMKKHAAVSDCACLSLAELGTDVQIVLENIVNTEKPFKVQECLYCQHSTESIFNMQEHLHSKHSQNDKLQYCFCESQFQTISEATMFLQDVFSHNFPSGQSSSTVLSHKNEDCNLNVHEQKGSSQIISFQASEGVIDMQLLLTALKQNSFQGRNVRILRSLFNRIQFKLQRKKFKCWYCKRKEMCLYKLRNHWRNCHVQTGKKFRYEITSKSWRKAAGNSCQTLLDCSAFCHSRANVPDCNSTLCICCDSESQTCFKTCVKQNCTSCIKCGNKNCGYFANTSHLSKCCKSLKALDTSSPRRNFRFDSDCLNCNSVCCSSCVLPPSSKVPYNTKLGNHKVKCNCLVPSDCLHRCHKYELCNTNQKRCQIHSCDVKHPAVSWPFCQNTKMLNNCTLPAGHSCLSNCLNSTICTKIHKCSKAANEFPTNADNVRLKIGLKKLPYYVRLPVFYLKKIMDLDPKIVLQDVKYTW